MNIFKYFIILIFIIIVLLSTIILFHPYSIFLFPSKLIKYKTIFENDYDWEIKINPINLNAQIISFLQINGYKEIDYFSDNNNVLNYSLPILVSTNISKDYLFLFWNKSVNNIGALVYISTIYDNNNPIFYLDHLSIHKKYRLKNYQTEILIYIYQYFNKIYPSPTFLIQKAAKPSKFLFPFNFKTQYHILSWNEINEFCFNDIKPILNHNFSFQNNELINHKLNSCFYHQFNNTHTFWFLYPLKSKKNNQRLELVFIQSNLNPITHQPKLLINIPNFQKLEYIIPFNSNKLSFNNKSTINRFWYFYPFLYKPLIQKNNIFIPLL